MRTREPVTAAPENQSQLLPLIDAALERVVGRGLMESIEVVDLLLDLRSRLVLERALQQMADASQSTKGN